MVENKVDKGLKLSLLLGLVVRKSPSDEWHLNRDQKGMQDYSCSYLRKEGSSQRVWGSVTATRQHWMMCSGGAELRVSGAEEAREERVSGERLRGMCRLWEGLWSFLWTQWEQPEYTEQKGGLVWPPFRRICWSFMSRKISEGAVGISQLWGDGIWDSW